MGDYWRAIRFPHRAGRSSSRLRRRGGQPKLIFARSLLDCPTPAPPRVNGPHPNAAGAGLTVGGGLEVEFGIGAGHGARRTRRRGRDEEARTAKATRHFKHAPYGSGARLFLDRRGRGSKDAKDVLNCGRVGTSLWSKGRALIGPVFRTCCSAARRLRVFLYFWAHAAL
jgi:hypothetical protein